MKKVIFISGFLGGKTDILLFKPLLKDFELIYFKYNTSLKQDIETISKQLKNFINKKLKKNEKVSIIAISAGGIIADYYLKFLDSSKIDKLVTICSPFKGTYTAKAFFGKLKGLKQIENNSLFLKELNKKKTTVKRKSIWCKFDPIVPGESAKGKNPKHTYFLLHPIVMFWPPVILEVKKFLR